MTSVKMNKLELSSIKKYNLSMNLSQKQKNTEELSIIKHLGETEI